MKVKSPAIFRPVNAEESGDDTGRERSQRQLRRVLD
jgi:hypothetical protein